MNEREKVIKGLECCMAEKICTSKCPYKGQCDDGGYYYSKAIEEGIALIGKQQEKIKELEVANGARLINEKDFESADGWGNIPAWYEHNPSFGIKTIDGWGIIKPGNLSDKETRYWTRMPTEEQREATPWND